MPCFVRDGNTWNTGSLLYVRSEGAWLRIRSAHVRTNNIWQQFYNPATAEPSLIAAATTVSQQGTESGGVCDLPYIFNITWTLINPAAGYTISIESAFGAANPPGSIGVRASGLALSPGSYDDTLSDQGFFYDAGGTQYYYQAQVRIIRTADSVPISSMSTNVISSEKVSACVL